MEKVVCQVDVHSPDGSMTMDLELHEGQAFVVGRESKDLKLSYPNISRQHLALKLEGQTLKLKDLESSNGTKVNGKKVHQSVIQYQDVVDVGDVRLKFHDLSFFQENTSMIRSQIIDSQGKLGGDLQVKDILRLFSWVRQHGPVGVFDKLTFDIPIKSAVLWSFISACLGIFLRSLVNPQYNPVFFQAIILYALYPFISAYVFRLPFVAQWNSIFGTFQTYVSFFVYFNLLTLPLGLLCFDVTLILAVALLTLYWEAKALEKVFSFSFTKAVTVKLGSLLLYALIGLVGSGLPVSQVQAPPETQEKVLPDGQDDQVLKNFLESES